MRHNIALVVLICATLLSAHPALAQLSQQGPKLVGTGAVGGAQQGTSVSLSADGNTAIVGGYWDNNATGAAWVWTRSGGVWTQQGAKLVGSGAENNTQGVSVSLSADGNTAIVGGPNDNSLAGGGWVWTRSAGVWTQQGTKLVGSGAVGNAVQGHSVSLSADGNTAIVGGLADNSNAGAAWVFAVTPISPCAPSATTLCLNNSRFEVTTRWTTPDGQSGAGQAVNLTSDTGYFWFFSSNNVEMVTKVVDGRGFNSRFWVFAGGLTNVNVVMAVTDTQTGAVQTYTNPQGTAFQPIQDTNAFPASTATEPSKIDLSDASDAPAAKEDEPRDSGQSERPSPPSQQSFSQRSTAQAPCVANGTTLCLNNGRFRVQTQWTTPQGQSGAGQAVALTADTGYFWFFSSNNVEMVVKAVNGYGFNSRYWVFAGGLTNVNVVMTVTDTQTGAVRTYVNNQGTPFQPNQDTGAFACP